MKDNNLGAIIEWLSINAPRITEFSLNKPATEIDIDRLKKTFEKDIPQDFIDLYYTYNGMNREKNNGNFFYAFLFLSIDDIIANKQFSNAQSKGQLPIKLNSYDKEIEGTNIYNPNWLAFGFDGARSYLILDLSPAENGTFGQIIFIDGDHLVGILIANSITELIEKFAKDINNGLYSLDEEALEDQEHFLAVDDSIDLLYWYNIAKWKHHE